MKNFYKIISISIISSVLLTGCAMQKDASSESISENQQESKPTITEKNETSNKTEEKYSIKDYMPLKENFTLTYENTADPNAPIKSYVEFINGNIIQIRFESTSETFVHVYEVKENEILLIAKVPDYTSRMDFTSYRNMEPEVILKTPLKVGTSWTSSNGSSNTITSIDSEIATNLGKFSSIEVTRQSPKGEITKSYYAPRYGLISEISKDGTIKISAMNENTTLTHNFKFYNYDGKNDALIARDKAIGLHTNSNMESVFENEFKLNIDQSTPPLIGPNVTVKKIYFNKNGILTIDFSSNFTSELKVGSGIENKILQAIVDSLGFYYTADKVIITLDGKPYNSGHISKNEGEAFSVTPKENKKSFKFFYYNAVDDKIVPVDKTISLTVSTKIEDVFEQQFKTGINSNTPPLLKDNIKIQKIYFNDKNILTLDLSSNFVSEMNLGGGVESTVLQCIVNSLGYYYNVNKVIITLDGKPYNSGHILMKEGEYFNVTP